MVQQQAKATDNNFAYRSHTLGVLAGEKHIGKTLVLAGWVHKKRDHGGLLFIDLRDSEGMLQCVTQQGEANFKMLENVPLESVVQITGQLALRTAETVNTELPLGHVEMQVQQVVILSKANPLPLQVNSDVPFPEETRLKYRFLDMRRACVQRNLHLRADVIRTLRGCMEDAGFLEVQTPLLTASSPEGARDYVVPSRVYPGRFYALPQAPQQFKQLLMAGGINRYFQIAPCFRDEDARSDRSPGDFYQLDFEMAFVTQDDVFKAIEPVMHHVFQKFGGGRSVTSPAFPRIPYDNALLHYGSDKPDLRNPLVISDVTSVFEDSDFRVFREAITQKGCVVRALWVPPLGQDPLHKRSRKFFDTLIAWAQQEGAGGLAYMLKTAEGLKGPAAKFLNETQVQALQASGQQAQQACAGHAGSAHGACPWTVGSGVFFICEPPQKAALLAGKLRTHLAQALNVIESNTFRFCWVVDFPMYEKNVDTGKIDFSHNPFSMPQGGIKALETQDPLSIKAWQYDIVVNGIELSSGAIRNHLPHVMVKAFSIAGYDQQAVEKQFGSLFQAFHYGVPPHGGAAPGIDRMVMLLAGEENLREVIPFPLNQKAQDMLMGAPAEISPQQLRELGLKITPAG